ncbi:MBL fold metallo-hydrolase [Gemmatimonas sp.]|jgi:glyoxylase-like metal-dependent hydrolase (beta-lactamase superfamily II)|uniref:MBL fold metallo-hydrolase n=1 Tax=Gemmatimonas sp. TaxID=1962908 RepID=UPI0022C5518B|nr:MBL fold metallo-hydrolase [Gemmatimonas sp.]MCZ8205043.1 MBL fold metallo-hydrolase [Gemmatimonas sp.]
MSIPTPRIRSLLLATTALAACSTYRPPVTPFRAPASVPADSWDSILAHPQPITVTTWVTGEVKVDRSLLLDRSQPAAATTPDDKVWVPVLAHRIVHATRGVYLVDTGLDSTFAQRGRGNIGGLAVLAAPFMTIARQEVGADPASRLRAAHDVLRGVFFTHLHLDHTAGVPGLPHDVPYVAGRGSLDDAYESGMMAHIDHLRGVSQLEEIDFSAARELAPLGKAVDLLGDGSLWAIHTPGHSRGHVSYLVNATSGPVLLIGDASHTRWGFEHGVAPGKVTDAAASRASLERIAAFARAYPRVKLVFGHDP